MGATSSYVVYLQQAVRPAFRGTVPNLGDLTTEEYSFVIKCPASRHLPVRRKNSSALQGRWLEEPEGFFHPVILQGEQNGHYGRRTANRRGVTPLLV